ncbi:MAG TPA: lactonase family protein [Pirellulaceae bacterium]|nr:lactonase family protein [Pirellulaceae bacterium]
MRSSIGFAAALGLVGATLVQAASAQEYRLWLGTYTDANSRGIYTATFDAETGAAGAVTLAAETEQPSFLALAPDGRTLVAVNETVGEAPERSGRLTSFAIDVTEGKLTETSTVSARGGAPCHLTISADGRHVLVANYVGGNVVSFALDSNGKLSSSLSVMQHGGSSVNRDRQEGPHAHCVHLDTGGRFAIAADLGTDRLYVHAFDPATGRLSPREEAALVLPAGAGPRHFAWHPDGKHAFVINELACTIEALAWDATHGTFASLQSITTQPDGIEPGNSTAEVVVHPNGRWVYGSNRGDDSIAVYAWDADAERLVGRGTVKTVGKTPRNFAVDPTGRWLLAANQSSGFVTIFRIDPQSGELTEAGRLDVPNCVCVRFQPLVAAER